MIICLWVIYVLEIFKGFDCWIGLDYCFCDIRLMEFEEEIVCLLLVLKFVFYNRLVYDKIIFFYFKSEKWIIFKS